MFGVNVSTLELAIKFVPTVKDAELTVPVWYAPVVLAIKFVPTVKDAELTLVVTLA